MTKSNYITAFILFLSIVSVSFAQNASFRAPPQTVKNVEGYLEKLEKIGYSGSGLVALNGKPVVSKGYGYSHIELKLKNSPKTIFDTGSITKQFTAAAILKLEMQGKLSTDDKITKFFENVPPDKSDITIHQLLRHSSGLRGEVGGDYEKIDLLENVINGKGYDLMHAKKLKEAIEIFKLNVFAFPQSANAFDSLGEAYLEVGDKESAVENYKRSLLLNPENENAREVLKRLEDK